MDLAQGRAHKMLRIASSYLLISRNYYPSHLATNITHAYIYTKGNSTFC